MNVNVTYLKLIGHPGDKYGRGMITIRIVNEEMEKQARETGEEWRACPRFLVLSEAEVEFGLSCLRGGSKFYPFFDDIGHHIQFNEHGIREAYHDGGRWEDYCFTMPGEELARLLEMVLHYIQRGMLNSWDKYFLNHWGEYRDGVWEIEVAPEHLAWMKDTYGPSFVLEYAPTWRSNGAIYDVEAQLIHDLLDERQTRLQECLDGIERIALNHSDGRPAVIRLAFDELPRKEEVASYGWSVTDADGRRIIWGGLIAHHSWRTDVKLERIEWVKAEDGHDMPTLRNTWVPLPLPAAKYRTWEYSTHT